MPIPVPSPPLTRPIAGAPARTEHWATGRWSSGTPGRGGRWALLPPHHAHAGSSCGVTPSNVAWCWGYNGKGQVGDGSTTRRLLPSRVSGGLLLKQAVAGLQSCGVTTGNRAYAGATALPARSAMVRKPTLGANRGRGRLVVQRREPGRLRHLRHHGGRQGLLLGPQRVRPGGQRRGPR